MIGAGIVGISTAYFLTRAGWQVRIVEAVAPADGATGAADGAVSVGSKRPGPMMALAQAGLATYRALAAEGVLDSEFRTRPTFLTATTDAERAVLDRHAAALTTAGAEAVLLTGAALRVRLPGIRAVAALEVRNEGHAVGFQVVHRLMTAAGLVVERGARVAALEPTREGSAALRLADGTVVAADAVIVAAGAGSAELLGLPGLFSPRKGQQIVTERAPGLNAALPGSVIASTYLLSKGSQKTAPGVSVDARGYGTVIDPLATGQFLIGSTREPRDDRGATDVAAVGEMARAAVALMPGLARLRLLRTFAGVRSATPDGLPLIGRMPGAENLFVATGFEGDGICLGPVTGRIVSDLVRGETPQTDIAAYDPGRFVAERRAA